MRKITNNHSQSTESIEKSITIMVTELKNSSYSDDDVENDAVRHREHHDIVSLAIRLNNGVFVKSIDNDMLFRFNRAQDAISAAVEIQKDMDRLNMTNKFKNPILMQIGLHSGESMGHDNKMTDNVINFARHIKSLTLPGETFASKDVYNTINNMRDINFRSLNQISTIGSNEPDNIYKVLWNPQEAELEKFPDTHSLPNEQTATKSKLKRVLIIIIPLLLVLLLTLREEIISQLNLENNSRAIHQSIEN